LWIEYSIPADFERQKQIIRHLRTWIESIEERGLVRGFVFDHYSGQEGVPDDLRVRFDYPNEANPEVENELRTRVREFVPDYSPRGTHWDSNEEILKGYEFGSRCAFLFWKLVQSGRFPEEYLSNYLVNFDSNRFGLSRIPFNFQSHFYHGLMNSLGVPKQPNELLLHLLAIIESKHFHSQEELCTWIRTLSPDFFRLYP
jgi:hypothetical protein